MAAEDDVDLNKLLSNKLPTSVPLPVTGQIQPALNLDESPPPLPPRQVQEQEQPVYNIQQLLQQVDSVNGKKTFHFLCSPII